VPSPREVITLFYKYAGEIIANSLVDSENRAEFTAPAAMRISGNRN